MTRLIRRHTLMGFARIEMGWFERSGKRGQVSQVGITEVSEPSLMLGRVRR
jgi:hypothetical protein